MTPGIRRRRGFTLIEVLIAGTMMTLVALLLSGAWAAFGRSALNATARCRLVIEADLAAESLARDFGGALPDPRGVHPGYRFSTAQAVDTHTLTLTFLGPSGSEPLLITYTLDPDRTDHLIRKDSSADKSMVVATLVGGFSISVPGPDPGIEIVLELTHRAIDRDGDGAPIVAYSRRFVIIVPETAP